MADLSPDRQRQTDRRCMLVHTLAPSLGLGLGRAGLGLGCAITLCCHIFVLKVKAHTLREAVHAKQFHNYGHLSPSGNDKS